MKNKARVRRNHSISPASPQVKIADEPASPQTQTSQRDVRKFMNLRDELDLAVGQSQALCVILKELIDGPEGGTWSDEIKDGVNSLVFSTNDRLEQAVEAAASLMLAPGAASKEVAS